MKNKHCKCGKLIADTSKRCRKCYSKWFSKTHKGKNNTNWKNGISKLPYSLKGDLKKYHKNYIKLHKSKILQERRKYYRLNKEKIIKNKKLYFRKKLKTDIIFKLKHYLRKRIYNALKSNIKSTKTIKLVGCNIEFLKGYLQAQFKEGMTWQNYGLWHIDHIKPCCAFDLSKPKEQHKCFNYKNLQPLWAKDNQSKGGKK
jgi:hypothetical protein